MKTIWKYELTASDENDLQMPEGAEVLTVQVQGGLVCIWAIVDDTAPLTSRCFEIFGTGHRIEDGSGKRKYVGTFQLQGGSLVFHVFELL